jgi:hypothetical protein
MIDRKDFAYLFMWGIQFDTELFRIASNRKKSGKGTYWTPAIMAFLDRLGTKLGFETDVERKVITPRGEEKWLDMLWSKNEPSPFHVFIEHEGSSEGKIDIAIDRLNGRLEKSDGEEADLKVLITYAQAPKYIDMLKKFAEPAQNVVIWYPLNEWPPADSSTPVDLTKFKVLPNEIEEQLHHDTSIYKLFGQ